VPQSSRLTQYVIVSELVNNLYLLLYSNCLLTLCVMMRDRVKSVSMTDCGRLVHVVPSASKFGCLFAMTVMDWLRT